MASNNVAMRIVATGALVQVALASAARAGSEDAVEPTDQTAPARLDAACASWAREASNASVAVWNSKRPMDPPLMLSVAGTCISKNTVLEAKSLYLVAARREVLRLAMWQLATSTMSRQIAASIVASAAKTAPLSQVTSHSAVRVSVTEPLTIDST